MKPDMPRGQIIVSEQRGWYALVFVFADPRIARCQWADVCLLCRDGQLSGCLALLALPYMDLCSRSERLPCKSIKALAKATWKPNLTKGGEHDEMLPELLLQESEGGGLHRSERKASCSSPGWCSCSWAGPQRQDALSLGLQPGAKGAKGLQRGAKDTFRQYVTDLLKTGAHPADRSSLPCDSRAYLKEAWAV